MSVEWTIFIPDIIREISQCPRDLIINTIKDVVRFICEDTKVWQNEDDITFTLPQGQNYYDASGLIPTGSEIDSIVWIKTDPETTKDISTYFPYRLDNDNIIRFDYSSGSDMDLYIRFSLKPTLTTTTIPDLFYNRCRFAIKHGVLSELMSNINTSWFNSDGFLFHRNEYERQLGIIKRNIWKGRTFRHMSVSSKNRFDI